jgi:hypothetical protein
MNFLYAAELKKTYRCYGHFYRLAVPGIDPLLCRSVLEITSLPPEAVGAPGEPGDLFNRPPARHTCAGVPNGGSIHWPDAVVIMMNPGSSRPIADGDTASLITMPLPAGFKKPLVLTQPDNTQYQIMRIMASRGWNHVRVLNISDLRDPKSPSFIARTKELEDLPGGEAHSLFCAARKTEREQMLRGKPGAPFILGWGQDAGLLPLARQCLTCIADKKTVTIPAGNDPALTAHPSPMLQAKKEAWLEGLLAALKI